MKYALINKRLKENNVCILCQLLSNIKCHTDNFWKTCKKKKKIHALILLRKPPVNKAVSEIVCAPWSFIFACGFRTDPPSQRWAHKCLYGK